MTTASTEPRIHHLDPVREPVEGETLTFHRHREWITGTARYRYTWGYSARLHDGRTGWPTGNRYATKAAALAAAWEAYRTEVEREAERVIYWNVFPPSGVGRLGRYDTLDETLAAHPDAGSIEARRE